MAGAPHGTPSGQSFDAPCNGQWPFAAERPFVAFSAEAWGKYVERVPPSLCVNRICALRLHVNSSGLRQ